MKHVALLDGDLYLHTAAAAVQRIMPFDEDGDMIGPYCRLSEAKDAFMEAVEHDLKHLTVSKTLLCLSAPTNFRYSIYPSYKSNRKNTPKPFGFIELREWAKEQFEVRQVDDMEADDVLGIIATKAPAAVIFSRDKDMLTLPAKLWREGKLIQVTEADANLNWMRQALTGDATDGYPGCPGYGPKKADTLLEGLAGAPLPDLWKAVVGAYEKADLTAADALTQARVARVLRAEDWNTKTKRMTLWQPPA